MAHVRPRRCKGSSRPLYLSAPTNTGVLIHVHAKFWLNEHRGASISYLPALFGSNCSELPGGLGTILEHDAPCFVLLLFYLSNT